MSFTTAPAGGMFTTISLRPRVPFLVVPLPRLARFAQWRTWRHIVIGFEAVNILARQVSLDDLFDTVELFDLIGTD